MPAGDDKEYWMRLVRWLIRGLFLGSGAILIASAFWLCISAMHMFQDRTDALASFTRVEAEVVAVKVVELERMHETIYMPTVRFTAADGEEYTLTLSGDVEPDVYKVGSHVGLAYPPSNPRAARESSFESASSLPFLMSSMAAIPFLIGVALLWIGLKILRPVSGKHSLALRKR